MNYSSEEVRQYIEETGVKFIRLAFCDCLGTQKNIAIMPGELDRAFKYGISIDASSISGFISDRRSDLILHPDPSTLMLLPWRPENGRVVRMFCDITYPDGRPFEGDARYVLKKEVKKAGEHGLVFEFGTELEFYIFKNDEKGEPTKTPYDKAGYMDVAPDDKGENLRREICLTLEQMGIIPETSHHEAGPGQNEIDFRYADAVSAADNAITFLSVVKTIAARNGLTADFSPKPLKGMPGNGMHINISVRSDDGEDKLDAVMAGILDRISDITLFLNPGQDSYERFGIDKAPSYISWATGNQSQLVKIPEKLGDNRRAELRSVDCTANPYITFSLLIAAGMEGVMSHKELPEPADINLSDAPVSILQNYRKLPGSHAEARAIALDSSFVRDILPENLISNYTR